MSKKRVRYVMLGWSEPTHPDPRLRHVEAGYPEDVLPALLARLHERGVKVYAEDPRRVQPQAPSGMIIEALYT